MDKREQRRYLTLKYQQKQVKIQSINNRYRFYDPDRYKRTRRHLKYRFYYELAGEYVEVNWWECQTFDELFTKERLGILRNKSWRFCGCHVCSQHNRNPRIVYKGSKKSSLTRLENVAEQQMMEDLKDYNNNGGYDEEVKTDLSRND